jgi:hypothetical protein
MHCFVKQYGLSKGIMTGTMAASSVAQLNTPAAPEGYKKKAGSCSSPPLRVIQ